MLSSLIDEPVAVHGVALGDTVAAERARLGAGAGHVEGQALSPPGSGRCGTRSDDQGQVRQGSTTVDCGASREHAVVTDLSVAAVARRCSLHLPHLPRRRSGDRAHRAAGRRVMRKVHDGTVMSRSLDVAPEQGPREARGGLRQASSRRGRAIGASPSTRPAGRDEVADTRRTGAWLSPSPDRARCPSVRSEAAGARSGRRRGRGPPGAMPSPSSSTRWCSVRTSETPVTRMVPPSAVKCTAFSTRASTPGPATQDLLRRARVSRQLDHPATLRPS